MISPDRGKVTVELGGSLGAVTLWYTMRGRRMLRLWLEENRPNESFGMPTEVSLAAYYWAGQLWHVPKLKYEDVEKMIDQVEEVSTLELMLAAARALAYATSGEVEKSEENGAAEGKAES